MSATPTGCASRQRFTGDLTSGRFNPLPKNPNIAELFTNIGLADALGSGTRNLFKYSWAYGGSQSVMTEGDVFEAKVPLLKGAASSMGTSFDVDEVISRMLRDYGFATVPGVAAIAGVTERTVRRHLAPIGISLGLSLLAHLPTRRWRHVLHSFVL